MTRLAELNWLTKKYKIFKCNLISRKDYAYARHFDWRRYDRSKRFFSKATKNHEHASAAFLNLSLLNSVKSKMSYSHSFLSASLATRKTWYFNHQRLWSWSLSSVFLFLSRKISDLLSALFCCWRSYVIVEIHSWMSIFAILHLEFQTSWSCFKTSHDSAMRSSRAINAHSRCFKRFHLLD
jgi:hypothetical protein